MNAVHEFETDGDLHRLAVLRRGSKKRIPGVLYNIDRPALVPSLLWESRVEDAGTAAGLGMALRVLDAQIGWEGLKKPAADSGAPFACLELAGKRQTGSGRGAEYLVHQPEPEVGPASLHKLNDFFGMSMVSRQKLSQGREECIWFGRAEDCSDICQGAACLV